MNSMGTTMTMTFVHHLSLGNPVSRGIQNQPLFCWNRNRISKGIGIGIREFGIGIGIGIKDFKADHL